MFGGVTAVIASISCAGIMPYGSASIQRGENDIVEQANGRYDRLGHTLRRGLTERIIIEQDSVRVALIALRSAATTRKCRQQEQFPVLRSCTKRRRVAQEYESDFEAAVVDAYHGLRIRKVEAESRTCSVPYDTAAQV